MLFLPKILTWFFFKIISLAGGFLLIQEPSSQFFPRLLQLLSLRPSTSPPAPHLWRFSSALFWSSFYLYLYGLVLITSPDLSSWLLSPFLSLALTFSVITPC